MLCGEQAVRDKYSSCQRRLIWSMSPQTHQSVMLALDLSFSVCFFPVGEFARPISTTAKPQLSYQLSSYCKLRTEALCPFISNTSLAQILFPHQNQTLGAGTRVLHSHPEISLPCWLLALPAPAWGCPTAVTHRHQTQHSERGTQIIQLPCLSMMK